MYGLKELKTVLKIDDNSVECPVKGCTKKVERQRKTFKNEQKYQCSIHKIYISPTTFEYESELENLLWTDDIDKQHLKKIFKVKRESRIARDNSEDALTWNVFRFLEKQNLLLDFLCQTSKKDIKKAELILWSYSPNENSDWSLLNKARLEFGESVARGSEPDIIILTDKVLYFIEAKLTANNKTKPRDLVNRKKYETGGNNLFQQIFKSEYQTIAIKEERYELMRFWLLGSWIANQLGLDFEFYNLVKNSNEINIETEFHKHINKTNERKFSRLTWEQINDFIQSSNENAEKELMTYYLKNKTIGYYSNQLRKAFDI